MICTDQFDGTWNVQYLDEPQYSGQMIINAASTSPSVSGTINKNGTPDGSYIGSNIVCPIRPRDMVFKFSLGTGHLGTLTLSLIDSNFGTAPFIEGYYIDDGSGDRGRILLTQP